MVPLQVPPFSQGFSWLQGISSKMLVGTCWTWKSKFPLLTHSSMKSRCGHSASTLTSSYKWSWFTTSATSFLRLVIKTNIINNQNLKSKLTLTVIASVTFSTCAAITIFIIFIQCTSPSVFTRFVYNANWKHKNGTNSQFFGSFFTTRKIVMKPIWIQCVILLVNENIMFWHWPRFTTDCLFCFKWIEKWNWN